MKTTFMFVVLCLPILGASNYRVCVDDEEKVVCTVPKLTSKEAITVAQYIHDFVGYRVWVDKPGKKAKKAEEPVPFPPNTQVKL